MTGLERTRRSQARSKLRSALGPKVGHPSGQGSVAPRTHFQVISRKTYIARYLACHGRLVFVAANCGVTFFTTAGDTAEGAKTQYDRRCNRTITFRSHRATKCPGGPELICTTRFDGFSDDLGERAGGRDVSCSVRTRQGSTLLNSILFGSGDIPSSSRCGTRRSSCCRTRAAPYRSRRGRDQRHWQHDDQRSKRCPACDSRVTRKRTRSYNRLWDANPEARVGGGGTCSA